MKTKIVSRTIAWLCLIIMMRQFRSVLNAVLSPIVDILVQPEVMRKSCSFPFKISNDFTKEVPNDWINNIVSNHQSGLIFIVCAIAFILEWVKESHWCKNPLLIRSLLVMNFSTYSALCFFSGIHCTFENFGHRIHYIGASLVFGFCLAFASYVFLWKPEKTKHR